MIHMQEIIRKLRKLFYQLPAQMVAVLVALVVLTAIATALPAIYLIRRQMEQQTWTLVTQGVQVSQTVLAGREDSLEGTALLISQRPSLLQLVEIGDRGRLEPYLLTLAQGADLDGLLICAGTSAPLATAGDELPDRLCSETSDQVMIASNPAASLTWQVAILDIPEAGGKKVIAARRLDDQAALELSRQTGLEQLFLVNKGYVAGSFHDPAAAWRVIQSNLSAEASGAGFTFDYEDHPYFAIMAPPDSNGLAFIAALPVDYIAQSQTRLTLNLLGGMLLVMLVSSLLGFFLAKRIGRPLERLRESATALRMGDLSTPVDTQTKVKEITQVAAALEDARRALQHSMAEAHSEKAWTDQLLESVVEGIVALDRRGRVTYFSRGAERITGWKADAVIGRPLERVLNPVEGAEPVRQRLTAGSGQQALVPVRIGSRTATLSITAARLAAAGPGGDALPARLATSRQGTVLVFRDVTDQEAMHRLLGDFLADITHEFRTPLAALVASMELLLDQLPSLSTAEVQDLLEALRLGALGLQTLIDNLLEGASIEAGRFRVNTRTAYLERIVHDAERTMQPLYQKYKRQLRFTLPANLPAVQADSRRTVQVLVNLLSNAVKWAPEGSEVEVNVAIIAGFVRVAVLDRGPGVPPERRADLFTRFAHTGTGSRLDVGAGIGLSVVKAIVEAQGGQAGMRDREGGGAEFWFTIPLAPLASISGDNDSGATQ